MMNPFNPSHTIDCECDSCFLHWLATRIVNGYKESYGPAIRLYFIHRLKKIAKEINYEQHHQTQ